MAERLGHASPAITYAIYEHRRPADDQAAALVWNNVMKAVIEASRQEHSRRKRGFSRAITKRGEKTVIPIKSAS